jgi:uncharacterized repeat protein (TIGR03803 family)
MTNDYASPGAVYKIRLADNRYKVIYRFEGQPDGLLPAGVLIKVNGLLYGVTQGGGTGCSGGCGTVFSITTSGTETVVYSFGGQPNGAYPRTGLTAVHSTFYGTTSSGGDPGCNYGCGTIFALSL